MVLNYQDNEISTLDDIQKLKAKDLRDMLRSHSESSGGMKADLVLKVYALLMRPVLSSSNANSGENEEVLLPQDQEKDECDFKYEETMRRMVERSSGFTGSATTGTKDTRRLRTFTLRNFNFDLNRNTLKRVLCS